MQHANLITASMLYNHLVCTHRVAMDAFGDWNRRDKVSPFVEMLWARGNKYEATVVGGLGEPFVDLSTLTGDEKEAATRAAIARGEALIYNGRLSANGLLGEPDLLRREGDGYVAIDIKSGAGEEAAGEDEDGKLKKHYGVQIALYTDLLDQLGVSVGRYGYIWDVHGEEVRYDLDAALMKDPVNTLWALYLRTRLEVGKLLTRETVSAPAAASVCKLCVWRSACLSAVKAADDLTLLPELGRAKRDALRAEFPTVHVLAAANVAGYVKGKKTEFPGVGPETLKRLQARAQLCVTPQAAPYFREPLALPTARLELFFDIETDPLRDLCYCSPRRRVDEIGEEERCEHAAAAAHQEAREEGTVARDVELHARLVSDRVAVVTGRDLEDVVRPVHDLPPVGIENAEPPGEHDPHVADLTPLSAHARADVLGPAPADVRDHTAQRELAELDEIRGESGKAHDLVRRVEALERGVGHRSRRQIPGDSSSDRPCTSMTRARAGAQRTWSLRSHRRGAADGSALERDAAGVASGGFAAPGLGPLSRPPPSCRLP